MVTKGPAISLYDSGQAIRPVNEKPAIRDTDDGTTEHTYNRDQEPHLLLPLSCHSGSEYKIVEGDLAGRGPMGLAGRTHPRVDFVETDRWRFFASRVSCFLLPRGWHRQIIKKNIIKTTVWLSNGEEIVESRICSTQPPTLNPRRPNEHHRHAHGRTHLIRA